LTRLESRKLIEIGKAVHILRLSPTGKPVNDSGIIWAPQAVRVPRVGLSSHAHVERAVAGNAQDRSDIEIAHEMSVEALRALIVPAADDPWQGRPRFANWAEQQTKGGHTDVRHEAEPRSADPATAIIWDACCPKCPNNQLVVSIYPDGATRLVCPCSYMQVWKAPGPEKIESCKNNSTNEPVSFVSSERKATSSAAANGVT
jgi:hypothetical protein